MTPPEIICPAPPPLPPTSPPPKPPTNGHPESAEGRTDLLAAIRNGTTLKKTPQEKSSMSTTQGRTSPTINGVVNGNSVEEAPKPINGMDKVQEELCEHFRARENGTLKKKSPAVQPIVKRLLTEKPTESARREDSERLMLGHGKRNFVIKKSVQNGGDQESLRERTPEMKKEVEEVQEVKKLSVSVKPLESTGDSLDGSMNGNSSANSREETPERENPLEKEVKIEVKTPIAVVQPLQMPKKSPELLKIKSVDITKIIKSPTTPQSPGRKLNHGRPNFTLPSRIKASPANTRKIPAEFLTVKLRETPNSPLLEPAHVPLSDKTSTCDPNVVLPPYRSATLGRKRESQPPSPLVPAAPTHNGPKYSQKVVVSFAMDLAATPNRYPDRVKKSPAKNEPEIPEDVAQLRQKKFSIDLDGLSVREQ